MALDLSPSDRELCSQSTISRLENVPDARALLRMGRAMVDLYCEGPSSGFPNVITLDIDDTFDAVHGGQQLRLFNAHYDEYGFSADRRVRWRRSLRHCRCSSSRQTARRQGGSRLPAPPIARDPRQLAEDRDVLLRADGVIIAVRRFSTGVGPTVSITSWASRRPRHCAGHIGDASRPARKPASRTRRTTGKARRFKEFFDGQGRDLEPGRAHHRPRRGRRGRPRHALRRHQSRRPQSARALRGCLLPAWPGRKITSNPGNGRRIWPRTAPLAPKPRPTSCGCFACMRAHTGSCGACACRCPNVRCGARRAVRHVTPAAHQNRRPRRRDEDDDQGSLCQNVVSRSRIYCGSRSGVSRAWSLEQRGVAPGASNHSHQPANILHPASGSSPETIRRVYNHAKTEMDHENAAMCAAKRSKGA